MGAWRKCGRPTLDECVHAMRTADTLAGGFPDQSGMPVARQLHWQRWLAAAAIIVVLAAIGRAFVNGQIEWTYVGRFLTAKTSGVMRAGMLSVAIGQYEAAQAIGMGRLRALRRIILPQAMRVVIPPLGNEFIGMVKATSLASVIQYPELLHNAENIYYANSRVI